MGNFSMNNKVSVPAGKSTIGTNVKKNGSSIGPSGSPVKTVDTVNSGSGATGIVGQGSAFPKDSGVIPGKV